MKKSMIMLMLAGLVIQPSLNAAGLFKRLKPRGIPFRGRKVQQKNVNLGVTPGQKTPGSPVAAKISSPITTTHKGGFKTGVGHYQGSQYTGIRDQKLESRVGKFMQTIKPKKEKQVEVFRTESGSVVPRTTKVVGAPTSLKGSVPQRKVSFSQSRQQLVGESNQLYTIPIKQQKGTLWQKSTTPVLPGQIPQSGMLGQQRDKQVGNPMNPFQRSSNVGQRVPASRNLPQAVKPRVLPKPNTYAVPDAQVDRVMNLFQR